MRWQSAAVPTFRQWDSAWIASCRGGACSYNYIFYADEAVLGGRYGNVGTVVFGLDNGHRNNHRHNSYGSERRRAGQFALRLVGDSGTRMLTVGYGTFTIVLSILFQLLVTFFIGRSSRFPELVFLITLIIPLFIILFFVYAPKDAERNVLEQQEIETNPWFILQVFAIIIAVLSFLMNGIVMLAITFFRGVKAIRISSSLEMERDRQRVEREKAKERKRRALEEAEDEVDMRVNQGLQDRAQD